VPEAGHDTLLALDGSDASAASGEEAGKRMLVRDAHRRSNRSTCIVPFNTTAVLVQRVTLDVADELRQRDAEYDEVPAAVQDFLEMARR
jgi:hypothetical protein